MFLNVGQGCTPLASIASTNGSKGPGKKPPVGRQCHACHIQNFCTLFAIFVRTYRWCFMCVCLSQQVRFRTQKNQANIQYSYRLSLARGRVFFARPWTQASNPALTNLVWTRRHATCRGVSRGIFQPSIRAKHDDLLLLLLLLLCCVYSRMIRTLRRCALGALNLLGLCPRPRQPTANCSLAAGRRSECVRASGLYS